MLKVNFMGGRQSTPTRGGAGYPAYPVQPRASYDAIYDQSGRRRNSRGVPVPPGLVLPESSGASQSSSAPPPHGGSGEHSSGSRSPTSIIERLRNMHARVLAAAAYQEATAVRDSDSSGDESDARHVIQRRSMPPLPFFHFSDIKCPVCSKMIRSDEVETHLVMCITKPRITYNEDVLTEDKGECVICLDELEQGQTIARLPCLCIYHKGCIDDWFERNRSCPEHPAD